MKDGIAAVGDVLAGKYRVEKILGIGGMGMVVAATHLELDQRVALKFMLPAAAESPETAARFLNEARAAGRLNSDHVCRMVDLGRFDSGAPYIVMEYLQGESLAAALRRRGPLRVEDAVDYILQAIEGLAEAHAHGIVHRDLKPDNLFLHRRNDGGTVLKVLDFGISKVSLNGVSTRTGDIMGSPAYMAPEQMESTRSVDARADVWSLGVVLYQMVTGQPPFRGDTLPLLCMHVVNDEPEPMSTVRGDLPDGFEAAAMRCLRKDVDERYRDVGELAHALAPFGPRNASTSASRIQIVLRRTGKHDSASLIPNEPVHDAADRALDSDRVPPNTLVATSGQSLGGRGEGRSWGVAGAVAVGLAVGTLVVVMLWRTGWIIDDAPVPPAVARPAPPVAPEAARPPGPIVEPILDEPGKPAGGPAATAGSALAAAPAAAVTGAAAPSTPEAAPIAAPADAAPAEAPAASVRTPSPPERKRHRPPRPRGAGKPAAPAAAGSGAGSSDDDDKWMHMTHDGKKP